MTSDDLISVSSDSSVVSVSISDLELSSQAQEVIGSEDTVRDADEVETVDIDMELREDRIDEADDSSEPEHNEPEHSGPENSEPENNEPEHSGPENIGPENSESFMCTTSRDFNDTDIELNLPVELLSDNSVSQFDYYKDESSWSESIETFIDQLNDVGINYDTDTEDFQFLKNVNPEDSDYDDNGEESAVDAMKNGQRFLIYLAIPVFLSQLLMLIILTSSSTSSVKSSVIVSPIQAIHYHHHHYYYYKIVHREQNTGESATKRFFYMFFNPFAAIYNSKYFKQSAQWIARQYSKQLNDPNSCFKLYFSGYLEDIKERMMKLNGIMKEGLDNEIGKALRTRDNWNRAVYDKIYEIAATPQYQRTVGTISKWASALKECIFS